MIYVGYPCIGKTTICKNKIQYIDLESSNFMYKDENGEEKRNKFWYKEYINVAEDLSEQGYCVFVSSHNVVIDELNRRNIEYKTIVPSIELKSDWIRKAEERYSSETSNFDENADKHKRALERIRDNFDDDVLNLYGKNTIRLYSKDYSLDEIIFYDQLTNNEHIFKTCSTCPLRHGKDCYMATKKGCVTNGEGFIIATNEEFMDNHSEYWRESAY